MSEQILTPQDCEIRQLEPEELKLAQSILYSAYQDDPLFMQIFRSNKADYEARLRAAIREEVATFWEMQQPIIGLWYQQQLLGVACLTAPGAAFQGQRLWHWRLKMLLTAGLLSSQQMLEKERRIHAAMPVSQYHMLAFIARNPVYNYPQAMRHFLLAIDHWVDQHADSEGIAVFVTMEKYLGFFTQDQYQPIAQLDFETVSGRLLYRAKQHNS